jgi:hypothetical protein
MGMKNLKTVILIIAAFILSSQAFALDTASINIKITVNQPPGVEEISPKDGYAIIQGSTLNITVTAYDPNSQDILQYQYYINGALKRDWTKEPSFNYILNAEDIGLNKIKVKVTDGIETIETEEAEIYVFRGSPDMPED